MIKYKIKYHRSRYGRRCRITSGALAHRREGRDRTAYAAQQGRPRRASPCAPASMTWRARTDVGNEAAQDT
jgi:hypothetical protein